MSLIKSISGIRGTLGGKPHENLTPIDIVGFTAGFGSWCKTKYTSNRIVIGRDARVSGEMVSRLVSSTLLSLGFDVVDLQLSTTPTVEMAVVREDAAGGMIITASHNPKDWNALKLLNNSGEFLNAADGAQVLELAKNEQFLFATLDHIGTFRTNDLYLQKHVEAVAAYSLVDASPIREMRYKVVVDPINSTGALVVPRLLEKLGVNEVVVINGQVNGDFAHNPEPLPENLAGLSAAVLENRASFGIAVDPDVDRLCFVCEDGSFFGEEYTLVAVADYVLSRRMGSTVSNMSSTKALKEVSLAHGAQYFPAAVGEVNVVTKMKEVGAVIGGEGNGGIIVPDFHYGRDALIGIGLFLTALALSRSSMKSFRKRYPEYYISKNKIDLPQGVDTDAIFQKISDKYREHPRNYDDGLKLEFGGDWVHLRTSNTEPIIRVYAESDSSANAQHLADLIIQDIKSFRSS